ncbi:type II toxin-antitoxin system Phd/YefM family antitoxin [Nitrospirillum sp. BR 11752]|uniref:type II toxin-antitoxin system Phd/YefM family antitoxin n=1 Tax=Nitrospirillum sp. BR 11752 TaxID=3104293 RepID=UPI002EAB4565|nr:type II toxin-antitoxin system Phd/YefM family antitoxin [Nitrospirillum sp. BR 11752]
MVKLVRRMVMAIPVNLYDAKTHLSQLVERAAAGEEIVIAKAGRPMARLVPLASTATPRVPGLWKGKIRIGSDFDAPLPEEIARAFGTATPEPATPEIGMP